MTREIREKECALIAKTIRAKYPKLYKSLKANCDTDDDTDLATWANVLYPRKYNDIKIRILPELAQWVGENVSKRWGKGK